LSGVTAGRVGRAHGRDGSFYVEHPAHDLPEGTKVTVAGAERTIERRAGTDARPLVRVDGVADRDSAAALYGEVMLIDEAESPLSDDEWRVDQLVGLRVDDIGVVTGVLAGPSCDVLEVGIDGVLIPLVRDAVKKVDTQAGVIEIDRTFLGL
jgi:16S rRNA processing protein RimM